MSIATRIESISNHLENAYDELQGLGADLTNVNKNIENISMVLDNIYDSMPQVSGEGTSLTLDNTRVGKIKSTLKGNASQDGTPTPTSPIPVNVVSGDNEVVVKGCNLLDFSGVSQESKVTVNDDGTVTLNGAGNFNLNFKEIDVIQGITYSTFVELVSGTITGNPQNGTGLMSPLGKNNWLSDNTQDIYTPNENKKRHSIWVGGQGTYNNAKFKIWAYVGSTPLPYEPYQDNNTYNIDLGVKNLWNSEDMKSGFLPMTGSYPTTNSTYPNARYIIIPLYKGQSLTTYSIFGYDSFRMRYIDIETNQIIGTVATGTNNDYCTSTVTYQGGWSSGTVTATKNILLGLFDFDGNMSTRGSYKITYGTKIQNVAETQIELYKIGNYQDSIKKSSGKNLCNTIFELGGIDTTTGQNGSGADRVRTKDYVKIQSNTTYTLSGVQGSRVACFYSSSKAYLSYTVVDSQSTSGTFITPNDASYIRWYIIQTDTNINEMLNEGSTALPYEPYGKVWYLHKEIGKIDISEYASIAPTGSWSDFSQRGNVGIYYSNTGIKSTPIRNDVLSNRFMSQATSIWAGANVGIQSFANDNKLAISVTIAEVEEYAGTTLNANNYIEYLKTYIISLRPDIYIILATPIDTEITYQPLIDQLNTLEKAISYENQTNIFQTNNDLPFIIEASVLKKND